MSANVTIQSGARSTTEIQSSAALVPPTILPPRWRVGLLTLSHAVAAILVATWLWAPTRAAWDSLDLTIFRTLNNSLAWGHAWQVTWAIANVRAMDLAPAVLMLTIFIVSLRGDDRPRQLMQWTYLLLIGLSLLAVKPLAIFLVHDLLGYFRPSPTVVLDETLRLSSLVPSIHAKDSSPWCFPSDHGYVLLMVMGYFWYAGRWKAACCATAVAVLFALPRMVSGAHWATDTLIGASVMALLATSWLLATPLHHWTSRWLYRVVRIFDAVLSPWGKQRGTEIA